LFERLVSLNIIGLAQASKNEDVTADIDNCCRPLLAQLVHQADAHATYTHEREVALARAFADRYATERNLLQAICLIAVAVGGSLWLTSKITEPIVASVRTIQEGPALASPTSSSVKSRRHRPNTVAASIR
jgi:methyl-accepting chemotaxis protein-1 (serine sensor receptor)